MNKALLLHQIGFAVSAFAACALKSPDKKSGKPTPVVSAAPSPEAQPSHPAAPAVTPMSIEDVQNRIWPAGVKPEFKATTPAEKSALETLVPAMLFAARAAKPLDPAWNAIAGKGGFTIEEWVVSESTFWAILEKPEERRGAGAYVFRVEEPANASRPEILLEAPHVFFDLGTEKIASRLFFDPFGDQAPRAFFTNTMHRYQGKTDPKARTADNPADVAHNPDHLFTAATVAFASALPHVTVIELHGFAETDREARAGLPANSTMVVSGGREKKHTARSASVAKALREKFDPGVRLFPDEASSLGATTNVQGLALRRIAGSEFLHLEMSASMRRDLTIDGERLNRLAAVLFEVATAEINEEPAP